MKNPTDSARKLKTLLRKAPKTAAGATAADVSRPIEVLIHSYLLWECTTPRADKAFAALRDAFIDENELRVSLPYEIAQIIGKSYPRNLDRCERLRATLNHIFRNEQRVTLERLRDLGKRDVRSYLDALDGMPAYVAARVALLAFEAHGIPADEQLRDVLAAEGICESDMDAAELSSWLSRHIKATRGRDAHVALQELVDRRMARRKGKAAASKATARPRSARRSRSSRKTARKDA